MSLRTVEVIVLDDSDDDGPTRITTTTQMVAPAAPSSTTANHNNNNSKKVKRRHGSVDRLSTHSLDNAEDDIDEVEDIDKKPKKAKISLNNNNNSSSSSNDKKIKRLSGIPQQQQQTVVPSLAIAASKPITPSPPMTTTTTTTTAAGNPNIKTLVLSPPLRATNITQVYPNYKTQPREALDLLLARFGAAASGSVAPAGTTTAAAAAASDSSSSSWYKRGEGSTLHQLPGLVIRGSPILLPMQTSYTTTTTTTAQQQPSEPTHLSFVKGCTSPTLAHAHLFAPQPGIVECPAHQVQFLNPYFNALLESSMGAEACTSLLGSHWEELFATDSSSLKRNYTVSVSMKIAGAFFQYSPLSPDIQRYMALQHVASSSSTTTASTAASTTTSATTTTTAVASSHAASQVIVPIGYVMIFLPSLYTGGTIRLSQKSITTSAAGLSASQQALLHSNNTLSEMEMDVNSNGDNHFQYRYVAWAHDGDPTLQSHVQVGSLISGCRLSLLYKLDAIIQSDLDVTTLTASIPSFFRCKLHPTDIPNFITQVVTEWNNWAPFSGTSTNISHPDQTSLVFFPNGDEGDASKKKVEDMLKNVIGTGTDLDFHSGTVTYMEQGPLKANSSSKLASVTSVSMEMKVDIMTSWKRTYTIPNQDIRSDYKTFFKNTSITKTEKVPSGLGDIGKRTRESIKCLVLWPRRRTWMVLQAMNGTTGVKTLKSIHCYEFANYLSYISQECMHKNMPTQVVRNNALLTELLEWWACFPSLAHNISTRFLDTIVNSKNSELAKLYISSFTSKTFLEKTSFDRGSMEPISSFLTHTGFLQCFSTLISKDSILRELGTCQLRHAINIAVGCYKTFTTGKTKPDIPPLLDDIICHVISLIINEKHANKKTWYESLKQELSAIQYDSEAILFLLQFASLQVDAKKKSRDYGKLAMDLLTTTVKAVSRNSINDDIGSRIGSYRKMTDHFLKNNLPSGLVQNILLGLVEEVDLNQAYKITYAMLSFTEYFSHGGTNYGILFGSDLINRIIVKKIAKYPVDSWSVVKAFLTRLGSEPNTASTGIDQSIKLSTFMKALQDEGTKRILTLDTTAKAGLINMLKATAAKHENTGGSFSILFDSDMKNFITFAALVGSEEASMFMKTLIESSTIASGGKLIVDLIRCVLDNQTASAQDFSMTASLLESFLARFVGTASPAHIAEINNMLTETSTSRPTLPKNTLSTIIEFKEKAQGKIQMNALFVSTMETFINIIMLAITHDANNKVKVKIEGSTDRCLAQRILSKGDLESLLRTIGVDRLIPFYESFCNALPITVAIGFTSEFVQFSLKRRTNISDEDRRAKSSILYLATFSVDAIFSISPDSLIKMELNLILKVTSRVVSLKGNSSSLRDFHSSFESVPPMAPAILLSSACALLSSQSTEDKKASGSMISSALALVFPKTNNTTNRPDAKLSSQLIEFVEVICDAWLQNWSAKKNFPDLDKYFTKESVQALVSYSGYDSVATSICKMADQFSKTVGLIPDLLIYFLCTNDAQKQKTLVPTIVASLMCTKPEQLTKEKSSILLIVLGIFKQTSEVYLKTAWEEAVSKLCLNGNIPTWQKTALGLVDPVFVAKEVPKETTDGSSDSKNDQSMTTHRVVIPENVKGGESFLVTVEGFRFKAVCPVGHTPGMTLLIRVPKKPEEPSATPDCTYELDLPPGVLPSQTINVRVSEDKVVQVICPKDISVGDKMRFVRNSTVSGPIPSSTVKTSELKLSSSQSPTMPRINDPCQYLLKLIKNSLSSDAAISILDYSEIFMYSTNEKSVQASSFFVDIAKHVLDVECGVVTPAAAGATPSAAASMIQSYCIVNVEKFTETEKASWNSLTDEFRSFLTSHCIKTGVLQMPQYKHRLLSQFVGKYNLPLTYSFTQGSSRKWQVSLNKTTSVPFDSKGVNMCSCGGQSWCYGSWREKGPCQALILNPHLPLERNTPKPAAPAKKKIDPDQVRSILTHFETMAKGMEVESEVEIVAPPQRSVALVEMLD